MLSGNTLCLTKFSRGEIAHLKQLSLMYSCIYQQVVGSLFISVKIDIALAFYSDSSSI